ncbi:MAG: AAA family ATPase, partial [Thermoanaerobaculia bacterium]
RGAPASVKPAATVAMGPPAVAPFVGREPQLEALRHAFESSRQGQAVTAFVEGSSGVGKTALVRRFLDSLPKGDVVVLSGRCYERESVPYKALDSLVDALSQYLKRQPAEQAEALLPRDILALARVFPVLRRVEAVSGTRRKVLEIADSLELRRRAFAALRELLARLAGRRDVVLFIDDLQWGDADSAALLEELMRPPDAPALLLIVSYRGEEAETSPFLKRLVPPEAAAGSQNTLRLAVGELTPSESRELALRLLGNSEPATRSHAEAIARESAGNPFFIHELVRFGQAGEPSDREAIDDMVRARVLLLPEGARRLLEIVAAAGRPLESAIADSAAGLTSDDEGAVALLRAQHLVRIRASPERQEIEPYHDRIREAVLAQLSPEMFRAHHRRLATTLQASERPDPERLALHFREAGDAGRAAEYAAMAAERAAETLAFDRAASLYRMALELGAPGDAQTWRTLRVKMGDALLNAGRGAEAARAYLAAAEGASRAQTMELEGRAAAQLVRSGRLDEALPLYETLTGRVGLTLVQPSWRTLLQYLVERALIRLRGVGFRERDAAQIPAEQLIRLDTYWTLFTGLTLVNTFRGREFQSRHLLLALKAREPYRAALALAFECGYAAVAGGWKKRKRSEKLFRMALTLAQKLNNPYAVGMSHMCMCAAALFLGQWKTCWENGQAAEEIYRERCTGVAWDLDFTHIVSLRGLFYLGGLRELSMRLPALIREARERDDLVAVGTFRIRHSYLTHLASDEPERARENLRQIVEALSQKAFTNPHYWAMIAGGEIALFSRDAKAARNLLVNQWPGFRRSGLIRLQFYRIEALHLRARSDLACAVEGLRMEEREAFLRSADRDVRRIEREAAPWGRPLARLVRAGIAVTRQNLDEASRLLTLAEDELTRLDMALYAAVARRRRGELLGGDEGRALVTGADAWMSGQVIKNPARMADMLAPGSWSR